MHTALEATAHTTLSLDLITNNNHPLSYNRLRSTWLHIY